MQPTQLFCTIKTAAERSEIDMLVRYSLSDYIGAAINTSEIEQLEDGSYVGRIPDCQGVIAFGDTLSECQAELRSTLEDWILVGLKLGHTLPVIAEIDLNREYVCESIDPV
ncbi:MAG: type II toxin-antitoxin system HicB family antitoxin [Microcystis panniformis WG22]|nr:type II toxin-antitoxin system HicB family antitoxin [Microcystis panniformis WG22]